MTAPQQPPYGPPAYGPPGYGAPGYGLPGYGPPGYGPPQYGPAQYGYGAPPWPAPPVPRPWPHGAGRPGVATAAGVLGIVTGGLTALMCLVFLAATVGGDGSSAVLLLFAAPCAVGMLTGGIRLLQGHRRGLLLGSALASVAVLLLGLVAGALVYAGDQALGIVVLVVLALPLPVATAILTAQRPVQGWTEGLPRA